MTLPPHAVGPLTVETERLIVEEIARLIVESLPNPSTASAPRVTLNFDDLAGACGRRIAYRAARAAGFRPLTLTEWHRPGRGPVRDDYDIDMDILCDEIDDALACLDPLFLTLPLREAA